MECLERYAALLEAGSETEWVETLLRFGREHGYDRTLLAVVPDRHTLLEDAFVRGNYPKRWCDTYVSSKLFLIDPVVLHCYEHAAPLIWDPKMFSGRLERHLYEEACGHGLRAGLTLPCHGSNGEFGILNFVSNVRPGACFRREAMRNIPSLSLLRDFAFESSLRLATDPAVAGARPHFTGRELECLKWSASGMTSREISDVLHCSERTVNFHFYNIRRKLKVTSRQQAVVKAMRMGLLHSI